MVETRRLSASGSWALPVLVLLSVTGLQAQDPVTIEVAGTSINGEYLKPYKSAYKTRVILPDGKSFDTGVWSEVVEHADLAGKPVVRVVQTWEQRVFREVNPALAARGVADVTWTLTNVVNRRTLAPIMSESRNSLKGYQLIEFEGLSVKETNSTRPPGGEPSTSEARLPQPVFNYHSGLFGILLSGLPLKEGYVARLPTYKPGNGAAPGKLEWLTFRVTGRESLRTAGGRDVEAWVVESDDNIKYWLTREAPHVLKSVSTGQPNRTWIFEVI